MQYFTVRLRNSIHPRGTLGFCLKRILKCSYTVKVLISAQARAEYALVTVGFETLKNMQEATQHRDLWHLDLHVHQNTYNPEIMNYHCQGFPSPKRFIVQNAIRTHN